jgi:putative membrane protein
VLTALGAVVAIAAVSPWIDAAAHDSLVVHMAQHLVLVGVAAPLLGVLGTGPRLRTELAVPRTMSLGVGATAASATLLAWHAPALFNAAADTPLLHAAEHASLLGTAVLLWHAVWRSDSIATVLVLFIAGLPAMALGAAMTLATTPWYEAALDDQRVAGALMWGAGSVTGLAAAAAAFALWLRGSPTRETTPARGSSAPRRSADGAA